MTPLQDNQFLSGKTELILVGQGIIDAISARASGRLVKTASSGDQIVAAMKAFVSALEALSSTTTLTPERLAEVSKTAGIKRDIKSRDITVRIASLSVKDSHYFMDISLDPIKKADKSLVMVSFLLREGYLGRYMIKRCFYYAPDNTEEAEATYDELTRKSEAVKKRYLQGEARPQDIMPQVKAMLDGIRGDFEFKDEDSLGVTVNRGREGYHEMEGPPYAKPPYVK